MSNYINHPRKEQVLLQNYSFFWEVKKIPVSEFVSNGEGRSEVKLWGDDGLGPPPTHRWQRGDTWNQGRKTGP